MWYISKIFKKSITNKMEVDQRFSYGKPIVNDVFTLGGYFVKKKEKQL